MPLLCYRPLRHFRRRAGVPAFHSESIATVPAAVSEVFALLDDHMRLSSHMAKPSAMMLGTKMNLEFDAAEGREVGARIGMTGSALGLRLSLEEVVTERVPPVRKVWETIGEPRLLVIGHYRMGFDITPDGARSRVRVFIDYDLPRRAPWRWFGQLLSHAYARWCTRRMAQDAAYAFNDRLNEVGLTSGVGESRGGPPALHRRAKPSRNGGGNEDCRL